MVSESDTEKWHIKKIVIDKEVWGSGSIVSDWMRAGGSGFPLDMLSQVESFLFPAEEFKLVVTGINKCVSKHIYHTQVRKSFKARQVKDKHTWYVAMIPMSLSGYGYVQMQLLFALCNMLDREDIPS